MSGPTKAALPSLNAAIIQEELEKAFKLLPTYLGYVMVKPALDEEEAHQRAFLQSIIRVSMLRIQLARDVSAYMQLPLEEPMGPLEDFFLRFSAVLMCKDAGELKKLASAFNHVDFSLELEHLKQMQEALLNEDKHPRH